MKTKRFLNEVRTLASRALANGGVRQSAFRIVWKIAGGCENPFITECYARPSPAIGGTHVVVARGTEHSICVEIHTRCRVCENCRRQRAALWRHRAEWETLLAPRTWFGTLTVRPTEHYLAQCAVVAHLEARAVPSGELTSDQMFNLVARREATEVTKMLKRLRIRGMEFRYLLVTEAHKSGYPHFHMLLHEVRDPVRYRDLEGEWPLGFSKWRLVADPKESRYLSKYLSKDARSRVRASLAYGFRAVNRLGVQL